MGNRPGAIALEGDRAEALHVHLAAAEEAAVEDAVVADAAAAGEDKRFVEQSYSIWPS